MNEPLKHYAQWKIPDRKTKYCMIPLIWNAQNRHIYRDRKLISSWHLGERRMWSDCLMGMWFSFEGEENVVQLCEYTKPLYTLKGRILWYMDYISKIYLQNKLEWLQGGFLHEVATNRLFYFYRGLSNIVRIGNGSLILTWHRIWLMVKGQISGAIVIKNSCT